LLYPSKPEDRGTGIIRLDPFLRRNIDATIDDYIVIRKIKAALAEKVVFASLSEPVVFNPRQLNRILENRVVSKDDILSFYARNRTYNLIVVDFQPRTDAVRIVLDTDIKLSEKTHKELIEKEKSHKRDLEISEEIKLGNKALRKGRDPKNAIKHYKKVLESYNGISRGDIFCRIAAANILLSVSEDDVTFLSTAEKYFQKSQSYFKEQISIIEMDLEELVRFRNDPEALKKYKIIFDDKKIY
jgi:hypothetical protein